MVRVGLSGRVATVTMDRPDVHNAFNAELIAELTAALARAGADPEVRAVVLAAEGKSFSAGADLNWMRAMAAFGETENQADALKLADLMRTLAYLPKPTIARIQGSAFGGGVGLIACCDVALADALDGAVERELDAMLKAGPTAMLVAKRLVEGIFGRDEPAQRKLDEQTAALIARLRVSMEGQEGLTAFLEKRPPNWL